jgi:hypothetical protein
MGPLPPRARPELGRGGPPARRALRPLWAPLRSMHALCGDHSSGIHAICSLIFLSTSRSTGVRPLFPRLPPILTISLITGATRAARVISGPHIRTPPFRAIGHRGRTIRNAYRGPEIRTGSVRIRRRVFSLQPQSHRGRNEELTEPPLPGKISLSLSTNVTRGQIGHFSANIN